MSMIAAGGLGLLVAGYAFWVFLNVRARRRAWGQVVERRLHDVERQLEDAGSCGS